MGVSQGNNSLPAGVVLPYAATTAPSGYLVCQGQAISRTTYSALYASIGTTYGAGDGSTTFNIPDMRNNVIAGYNTGQPEFSSMGKKGGEITHTLTSGEMPAHTHNIQGNGGGGSSSGYWNNIFANTGGGNTGTQNYTDAQGGGAAHNNLQPYITLNYIIKY